MSEVSTQIRLTFQNVIKVYQEISSMLQDADLMMDKGGVPCLHSKVVGAEQSKSMTMPQAWMPPFAARYYGNEQDVCLLRVIVVLLLNKNYDPIEPLVVFGCLRLREAEEGKRPDYWYGYIKEAWFSWLTEQKTGEYLSVNNPKWNVVGGKVYALPLEEVKDQDTLREKVVEPLLMMSLPSESGMGDGGSMISAEPEVDGQESAAG